MAHETRFKFKVGNDWVYQDELAERRERRNAQNKPEPMPQIDISSLPTRAELDPDQPLEDLFYNCKALRRYLSLQRERDEHGDVVRVYLSIRRGLPPEFRGVAQDLLRKYQKPTNGKKAARTHASAPKRKTTKKKVAKRRKTKRRS